MIMLKSHEKFMNFNLCIQNFMMNWVILYPIKLTDLVIFEIYILLFLFSYFLCKTDKSWIIGMA